MKKNKILNILLIVLVLLLCSFSSAVSKSDMMMSPDKEEAPSTMPSVVVEFVRDPLPVPRRGITFVVYSNDNTLSSVNIEITYKSNGRVLHSEERTIQVSIGIPYTGGLTLFNYGFGQGQISVRLWKHDQNHHFDYTFYAKTFGFFFYVSVL